MLFKLIKLPQLMGHRVATSPAAGTTTNTTTSATTATTTTTNTTTKNERPGTSNPGWGGDDLIGDGGKGAVQGWMRPQLIPRGTAPLPPHTPKAVAYHEQSHYCRFMIGHSLGRMYISYFIITISLI